MDPLARGEVAERGLSGAQATSATAPVLASWRRHASLIGVSSERPGGWRHTADAPDLVDDTIGADPELAHLKGTYREAFRATATYKHPARSPRPA